MKRFLTATLATMLVAPAAANAQDLAVHTGMPIVVSFLGKTSGDGATDRKRSAHLGIDFTVELDPVFQLGGSIDGVYIDGTFRDTDGFIYSVTAGPMALITSEPWTGRNMVFTFGVVPGLLVLGASDKAGNARAMVAAGGMAEASMRFRLTQSFSLGIFGSFGAYSAPLGEKVWLGQQLGPTMLAGVDLGIVWHF